MQEIIEAQLTFETYLKGSLEKVQGYLDGTISEFETELRTFLGEPPVKPLSELPSLCEFVRPYKASQGFKSEFKYPFREALDALGIHDEMKDPIHLLCVRHYFYLVRN